MQTYIGTKMIRAKAMTRGDYNKLRGWSIPADENPNDEGFLVEYLDGGERNHKDYDGYISWSPKDVFERAYRPVTGMTFGQAIEAVRAGFKVARAGWNGKGMWVVLVPYNFWSTSVGPSHVENAHRLPWIGMKTVDGGFVPWLASQADMLCEDWVVGE